MSHDEERANDVRLKQQRHRAPQPGLHPLVLPRFLPLPSNGCFDLYRRHSVSLCRSSSSVNNPFFLSANNTDRMVTGPRFIS